jgi:hypothetical protein
MCCCCCWFVGCVVAQAFGFPFIEPILLENVTGFPINFIHGVNFAYAGATAEPDTTFTPAYLQLELEQFLTYKAALSNSPRKEKNNNTLKYSTYSNKLASLKH